MAYFFDPITQAKSKKNNIKVYFLLFIHSFLNILNKIYKIWIHHQFKGLKTNWIVTEQFGLIVYEIIYEINIYDICYYGTVS